MFYNEVLGTGTTGHSEGRGTTGMDSREGEKKTQRYQFAMICFLTATSPHPYKPLVPSSICLSLFPISRHPGREYSLSARLGTGGLVHHQIQNMSSAKKETEAGKLQSADLLYWENVFSTLFSMPKESMIKPSSLQSHGVPKSTATNSSNCILKLSMEGQDIEM